MSALDARICCVTGEDDLTTATAFWSYAHSDNEEGQIERLKQRLDSAYKRHRGEALASFFDKLGEHKIEWGEEWRSKISNTISGTTFFIPVISPSYVKSSICRTEFDEFNEKAKASGLNELIMPIFWVPVYPETPEEQRIFDAAQERQWVDWSQVRKLDENLAEYKRLIDEMGERLANVAREVAAKPEVIGQSNVNSSDVERDSSGSHDYGPPEQIEDAPGILDLAAESIELGASVATSLSQALDALNTIPRVGSLDPPHAHASTGQRLFFFKRIANEIWPYAQEFERKAKEAEESVQLLQHHVFDMLTLLSDADTELSVTLSDANSELSGALENVGRVPETVRTTLQDISNMRSQVSNLGRMSRDLRVPMSAVERGFDALDAVVQLTGDWTTAFGRWRESLN